MVAGHAALTTKYMSRHTLRAARIAARGMPPYLSEAGNDCMVRTELFRLNATLRRDPAVERWLAENPGELGALARDWFEALRECGDEVREVMHDGGAVACLGDAAFAYVQIFTAHVNVGFFQGSALPDPAGILQGAGKFMRHVKLKPGTPMNRAALSHMIDAAFADIKAHVEHG